MGALGFALPPDPGEMLLPKRLQLAGSIVRNVHAGSKGVPLHQGQGAPAKTRTEQNRVGVRLEQHVEVYVDEQTWLTRRPVLESFFAGYGFGEMTKPEPMIPLGSAPCWSMKNRSPSRIRFVFWQLQSWGTGQPCSLRCTKYGRRCQSYCFGFQVRR